MWQFNACSNCRYKIHRGRLLCPVCLTPRPHRMAEGPGLRKSLIAGVVIVVLINVLCWSIPWGKLLSLIT